MKTARDNKFVGEEYLKQLEQRKELLNLLKEKRYIAEVPQDLDEFIIPLEKRNLIERSIEKIKQVYITEKGKEILPKIKFEKKIDVLTPEIIQNKEWKKLP